MRRLLSLSNNIFSSLCRNWRSGCRVQTLQHSRRRAHGIGQRPKIATGERTAGSRGREVEEAVAERGGARRGRRGGRRNGGRGPLRRPGNGTAAREGGAAGVEDRPEAAQSGKVRSTQSNEGALRHPRGQGARTPRFYTKLRTGECQRMTLIFSACGLSRILLLSFHFNNIIVIFRVGKC